jgi:hypothetical protein
MARYDYNYFNDTPEDALRTEAIEAMGFDAFYVSEGLRRTSLESTLP